MADQLSNIKGLFQQGRTRVIILVTMFVLLMAIVVGVMSMRAKVKGTEASANVSDAPGDIQSVPFDAPNEEYARLQQEQNEQQAKQAESVGGSAIPTIFKSSKDNAGVSANMDGDAGLGFTGLSREQQAGVVFEPKSFDSSSKTKNQNCPSDIIASSGSPVYDANGRLIGYAGSDGKLRDISGKIIGTVNADGSVSDLNGNKIGKVVDANPMGEAIYDANGRLVGYASADGKVRDLSGKVIGVVGPDGIVRDATGKIIGQKNIVSKGLPVYDANGRLIGYTGDDGKVYDATGKIVGIVGTDGIVRDMSGKAIGQLSKPVYDANGKLIGFTGPDGKVRDLNNRVIGSVDADGVVRDLHGVVIGKAGQIAVGTPVYDAAGNVIGFVGPDGKVRDANGNTLGVMGLDGKVRDINGNIVASIAKPNDQNIQKTAKSDQQATLDPSSSEDKNLTPEQLAKKNMAEAYAKERMMSEDKQLSQLVQKKQQAMSTQANQLLAAWAPATQQYVVGQSAKDSADGVADSGDSSNQNNNDGTKKAIAGPVFIKAGTIYYGVINTSINSDEPGPIMGTLINGEFKGGKLLGILTNQGKAVMLSFNILTLPQFSKSIPINAVAIDQNTARTGLSTETDNHYLLRYGTLFASSFISGYSQAIASSGSTVETTLLGTVKTTPPLSPREKFAMALGNVGTQLGNQLGSTFSRPPTVYVASGTAVGILFMSDVSLPTS